MSTNSYPAVGSGGLTETQWAKMYAGVDGIVEDLMAGGVSSLNLTRNNSTNVCTISPGLVKVNGYTLEVTAAHDLSTPPVGSGSVTYRIAGQYDPALNVGEVRSEFGPCRLIVTSGALDTSSGKEYTLLYEITRVASQVLTEAPVVDRRRWVGPVVEVPDYSNLVTGVGPFPRGTIIVQTGDSAAPGSVNMSIRTINEAGNGLVWKSMTGEPAVPFPAAGTLVAQDEPATMYKEWTHVHLQGTLRRATSGANLNNGSPVILGTLPPGWRPRAGCRFIVLASGPNPVGIVVTPSGTVSMYDPVGTTNVSYVQLNGISFRAEG